MRSLFPRTNRGTSLIAAIFLAAVLGAIALGLNALESGSTNTRALPAAGASGTFGDPAPQTIQSHNKTCDQVIADAASNGKATDPYTVTDKGQNIKDSCNAAVVNQATVESMKKNYPGDWQFHKETYKCVGESGTITDKGDGTFTESMAASENTSAGSCVVKVCDASGKCYSAVNKGIDGNSSNFSPTNPSSGGDGSSPVTPNNTNPGSGSGGSGGGMPSIPSGGSGSGSGDTGSYTGPCPSGQTVDPATGSCSSFQGACPNGQAVDPTTGSCQTSPTPTCTTNSNGSLSCPYDKANPTDQKAVANSVPAGYSCSDPNNTGVLTCVQSAPQQGPCPNGQTANPNGTCPGQTTTCTNGINCGQVQQGQTYYCTTSINPLQYTTVQVQPGQTPPSTGYGCSTTPPTGTNGNNQNPAQPRSSGSNGGTGSPASTIPQQQQQQQTCSPFATYVYGCQSSISCQLTIQPNPLQKVGLPATLSWTTTGSVYSAQIAGVGGVPVPSGQYTVYPQSSMSYSMTVYDQYNNQNTCTAPITVTPAQSAPYGTGTNGQACPQPPTQPDASQCTVGSWQPTTQNGCTTGWRCLPSGATTGTQTPSAQISCQPQTADVGQSVAISYACSNSTASSGGGFSTGGALSGATSTIIATPPSGTNTANFAVTCANQNVAGTDGNALTASAQCSVQINQPSITLASSPKQITSGQVAAIGWVTSGMQSCRVSSPTDTAFTQANTGSLITGGIATTSALTATTEYDLTCQTLGGLIKNASTTVTVATSSAPVTGLTITSTIDGITANHAASTTITWSAPSATSSAAISLWLVSLQTQQAVGLIAQKLAVSGSYVWTIPQNGSSCNQNSINVCASDLIAGQYYGIEAALYTPSNAFLGGTPVPSGAIQPTYLDAGYTPQPFLVGQ